MKSVSNFFIRALLGLIFGIVAIAFVVGIVIAVNVFDGIFDNDNHNSSNYAYSKEDFTDYEDSVSDVSSLVVNNDIGLVVIKTGDSFKVSANDVPIDSFTSRVVNGVWQIECDWPNKMASGYSMFSCKDCIDPVITITVPEGFRAEDIEIKLSAGRVKAELLSADNISIDLDAGEVDISRLISYNSMNCDVSTGNVEIDDLTANDITLNCNVGNIDIEGYVTGNNNITCNIGAISVKVYGDYEDYNYYVDCGLGEVQLGNSKRVSSDDVTIHNTDSSNSFNIKCDIGSIQIAFK